ncbi:vesicle-associated membrane protein 7-like [Trichoplusia ni]|uniref:Vesicle-associated membrane protein 7-like n=1 Tax=Trichoplusia ni TaxID=7111 RepID=A0A7E5X0J6_TRINI|nr:vesicle-associated membrane protein 7-like [Trichoplusia ni]
MPILFSAVACDSALIANFASCDGNFLEIAEQVLPKLPASNKMTYSHGIYLLHYIAEDNYTYFCITDRLCQRSRSFLFLNEIQRQFAENKVDFTSVLAAEMYRYSEDYSTINIRKGELDELNKIGVGCSESILGEKILYVNNPDNISYSTISYVHATPETISLSEIHQETNSEPELTSEEITLDSIPDTALDPEEIADNIVTSERITEVIVNPEKITESLATSKAAPEFIVNAEKIEDVLTPRLYIVIIGMMILVIAMAVYAFGPISCAVVTSVGIYSLFRSFASSKDKSSHSDAKEN